MLRALFTWISGRFELRWGYDASYMRHVLRANPVSFLKFAVVTGVADRRAAPPEALAAALLAGVLAEDCGPCAQLAVDIATADGVPPQVLHGILAGDQAAMGEAAAVTWRFAQASLAHDLEAGEAARAAVAARWGDAGLVALSLTLMTGRMYPTLKYALGHGVACSKVQVAGETARFARPAIAA